MKKQQNIYVMMSGRCGNQLFQYAYGRAIQLKNGGKLYLDYTWFDLEDKEMVAQGYKNVLEEFQVADYTFVDRQHFDKSVFQFGQLAICRFLSRAYNSMTCRNRGLASVIIYFLERVIAIPLQIIFGVYFIESVNSHWLHLPPMPWHRAIVLRGFFESEKYFHPYIEKIRDELQPKEIRNKEMLELLDKMKGKTVTCISVRRGDFLSDNFKKQYYVCDESYFQRAVHIIKQICPDTALLVCSDDIEWCKENLKYDGIEMLFEPDELTLAEKLSLMKKCNHFILSNSTFSWWGQALSKSSFKVVIAPKKWRKELFSPRDIYVKGWFLI